MASFGTAQPDPYEVLGVPSDASLAIIKTAFRAIAKANHPDVNPGNARAEARMKAAVVAYAIIGDAEKRREFDGANATPKVDQNDLAATFWADVRPTAQASGPNRKFGMFDAWTPGPLWNAKNGGRLVKDVHEA